MLRRAVAILMVAIAARAGAQESPLSLRVTGADTFEAHTRQAITFALAVSNEGPQRRTLALEYLLPDGWKALTQESPFSLEPSAHDLRVVSFLIPSRVLAGEYALRYQVRDLDNPSVSAECTLKAVVLPEVSLDLKVLESPAFVIAGNEYTVSFVLSNTGNTDVQFSLDVVSGSSLPYEVRGLDGKAEGALPAGGVKEFAVAVRTGAWLLNSMRHPLQVSVLLSQPEGAPEAQAAVATKPLAKAASSVEVVPLSVDDRILTHTIPGVSETSVSAGYDQQSRMALQESVKARGTLDEAGEHKIELDVTKQVDSSLDTLLNPMDRYSLQYKSRFGELLLGDFPYALSPLLEMDAFGRGIQGTVNLFPIRLSALYYREVWSGQGSQGLGGTVDFTVPRSGDWSDVLYRAGLSVLSPLSDRTSFGVLQQFNPVESVQFQLDTAMQSDLSGALTPAVFALSEGDLGALSWTARFIRAWPGFEGTYSDTQSMLAIANTRLLKDVLSVHGIFFLQDNNLLLSTALPSADRTMEISLGAGGEIPGLGMRLTLDYENWRRLDMLPARSYATWDNIVRFSLRQPFTPFTLNLGSQVDSELDEKYGGSSLEQSHVLTLEYQPSDSSQYGFSLRYNGRLDPYGHAQHLLGWDLSSRYSMGTTRVEGLASNSFIFSQTGFSELLSQIEARLSHTFPWAHTFTAQADFWLSYEPGIWTPSYTIALTYGVPFELPVSRKPDTAVVTGSVYNAATGERMPGVILRLNGLAAITNAKGEFTFYLPHSGQKYIQVDMGTVAANIVPVKPMPLEVSAPRGSKVIVEIGMIEACTVTGNVGEYGFPEQSAAYLSSDQAESGPAAAEPERIRLRGLGNVIVELSDGTETHRKLTGPNGDFSFEEVRPGKYTLRITDGRIPAYHTLEPESFEFELTHGEKKTVEFHVIQDRRVIKIVESGVSIELQAQPGIKGNETVILEIGKKPAPSGAPEKPETQGAAPQLAPEAAPTQAPVPAETPPEQGPQSKATPQEPAAPEGAVAKQEPPAEATPHEAAAPVSEPAELAPAQEEAPPESVALAPQEAIPPESVAAEQEAAPKESAAPVGPAAEQGPAAETPPQELASATNEQPVRQRVSARNLSMVYSPAITVPSPAPKAKPRSLKTATRSTARAAIGSLTPILIPEPMPTPAPLRPSSSGPKSASSVLWPIPEWMQDPSVVPSPLPTPPPP